MDLLFRNRSIIVLKDILGTVMVPSSRNYKFFGELLCSVDLIVHCYIVEKDV